MPSHTNTHISGNGGKRLAKTRHNLDTADLAPSGWREEWECARDRIAAKGAGVEPFGNLTITVTPDGEISLRLPKPLEHLANAAHGRYVLGARAVFAYRADEWKARITSGKSMSYAITRRPGQAGPAATSPPRGPSHRNPSTRRHLRSGRTARWWVWISTTDTLR